MSLTRSTAEIDEIVRIDRALQRRGFKMIPTSLRWQTLARDADWGPFWSQQTKNSTVHLYAGHGPDRITPSVQAEYTVYAAPPPLTQDGPRVEISEHIVAPLSDIWWHTSAATARLVEWWHSPAEYTGRCPPVPMDVPLPIAAQADALGLMVSGVQGPASLWSVAFYPADPKDRTSRASTAFLESVGMHRLGGDLWVGAMTESGAFRW